MSEIFLKINNRTIKMNERTSHVNVQSYKPKFHHLKLTFLLCDKRFEPSPHHNL